MNDTYSLITDQENPISNSRAAVGTDTNNLKERFKEGSIPLQTDFNQLIDIADVGRKAMGQSTGQSGAPGAGLQLDIAGLLSVKLKTSSGLTVGNDGLSVTPKPSFGLATDASGLYIALNSVGGLNVSSTGVAIKPKPSGGLAVSADGASVTLRPSAGLAVDNNGISVSLNSAGGLNVAAAGVGIKAKPIGGLMSDTTGASVMLKPNGGVIVDSSGISVKPGRGMEVTADGVSIKDEFAFQKGMILMFSGSVAPTGWALCDGQNNTPNLIDRFIMGGTFGDQNGKSSTAFSGGKNAKLTSITTKKSTVAVNGSTDGTAITLTQMPTHNHIGGLIGNSDRFGKYGSEYISFDKGIGYPEHSTGSYGQRTSSSGNGEAHKHNINFTTVEHGHDISLTVPYYILAFIIKL
ncbi:tail fiber protein [Yersinia pekkanenii]|uniref:Phage Tail Collar Domain n=1 Tax=Yersinia pekkanenii TaxID=1288385 RepID=A0A0T9PN75_9GAMM|nr:tail fiber protein [Yersinia pekkanenii]CNH73048.1 Phage Tail Collar Domain [Yersinia pekkanenii]CRY68055.1 Phage Tail Collar Domain [Yersinia pekkanenii]